MALKKPTTHPINYSHRKAGLCTTWSQRLEFQSIAWDMRGAEGWASGRGQVCSENKWEKFGWIHVSLYIGRCQNDSQRCSELQGGRLNQMIITPILALRAHARSCPTDSQWRNGLWCIVWGAPVFLWSPVSSQWQFPVYIGTYALTHNILLLTCRIK